MQKIGISDCRIKHFYVRVQMNEDSVIQRERFARFDQYILVLLATPVQFVFSERVGNK